MMARRRTAHLQAHAKRRSLDDLTAHIRR